MTITEQIGGVIKAESKNGARFTLEIPRVENNFT